MNRNTIKNIFNFLKEKEGKEVPNKWVKLIKKLKLIKELEAHPDGTQFIYYNDLSLSNSNITQLPKDLYVTGDLHLRNCQDLTKLADKLHVGGHLDLTNCKQLTELPNNLYVEYSLDLNETNIEKLPNNLYVGRNLWLHNASLADKYTDEEIYEIVASTGGKINGRIIRFF